MSVPSLLNQLKEREYTPREKIKIIFSNRELDFNSKLQVMKQHKLLDNPSPKILKLFSTTSFIIKERTCYHIARNGKKFFANDVKKNFVVEYSIRVLEDRWVDAEKYVMEKFGYSYAQLVMKKRWPELENKVNLTTARYHSPENSPLKYFEKFVDSFPNRRWIELEKQLLKQIDEVKLSKGSRKYSRLERKIFNYCLISNQRIEELEKHLIKFACEYETKFNCEIDRESSSKRMLLVGDSTSKKSFAKLEGRKKLLNMSKDDLLKLIFSLKLESRLISKM